MDTMNWIRAWRFISLSVRIFVGLILSVAVIWLMVWYIRNVISPIVVCISTEKCTRDWVAEHNNEIVAWQKCLEKIDDPVSEVSLRCQVLVQRHGLKSLESTSWDTSKQ